MPQIPPSIVLVPGRSRWLAAYVALSHGAALCAVSLLVSINLLWGLMVIPLALSLRSAWAVHVSHTAARAVCRVEWGSEGNWTIVQQDGGTFSARLLAPSFVSPRLTILSFSLGGLSRRRVLLLPDNVGQEQLRRLRVRLSTGFPGGRPGRDNAAG